MHELLQRLRLAHWWDMIPIELALNVKSILLYIHFLSFHIYLIHSLPGLPVRCSKICISLTISPMDCWSVTFYVYMSCMLTIWMYIVLSKFAHINVCELHSFISVFTSMWPHVDISWYTWHIYSSSGCYTILNIWRSSLICTHICKHIQYFISLAGN